ncbi:MAG TPA: hypothetical protein VH593_25670 [Ktedonobacteraceae bacterium]|jgi:uncharacterized membrane protein
MTSLGLDERLERVLAYSLFWVSGILLLLLERNRNVRWHAMQSIITFGALTLLLIGVNFLKAMLAWIPVLNLLTNFGLGLLANMLGWVFFILWIWLIAMAWIHPDYRLPYMSRWIRNFL